MKRSIVNKYLKEATEFMNQYRFKLPPWAFWTQDEWKSKGHECDEIRKHQLGWDITDFGSGDFEKVGLLLFTIRNGRVDDPDCKKTYAEKIMIARENQVTPIHFHWFKMEDIINRGGGDLVMRLWKSDENEALSDERFSVQIDGVTTELTGGETIRLKEGESIALEPYVYHTFWCENGMGLIGEVSKVNDDASDNRFYEPAGRFPDIEEDEKPLHLLCNEYPSIEDKGNMT